MASVPDTQRPFPTLPAPSRPRLPWLRQLDAARPRSIVLLGLALLAVIGLLDYLLGAEIVFDSMYLLPVSFVAWYAGWRWGMVTAAIAVVVGLIGDLSAGLHFSQPAIYVWNSLMALGPLGLVAYLLPQLRAVLQREQQLARTDYITGAMNSRAFYEALQLEIMRANRYGHPLTLAYLDLDNFKSVNDQLGHAAGDEVLRRVVSATRGQLRASDLVARMGGDEFALLLPETGPAEARAALGNVRQCLLETTRAHHPPVTVSIGALVCPAPDRQLAADDLLHAADDLMYTVKRAGKNNLQFAQYPPPAP